MLLTLVPNDAIEDKGLLHLSIKYELWDVRPFGAPIQTTVWSGLIITGAKANGDKCGFVFGRVRDEEWKQKKSLVEKNRYEGNYSQNDDQFEKKYLRTINLNH